MSSTTYPMWTAPHIRIEGSGWAYQGTVGRRSTTGQDGVPRGHPAFFGEPSTTSSRVQAPRADDKPATQLGE
jgi:hypothetical protein